jgi:hypothetical protein
MPSSAPREVVGLRDSCAQAKPGEASSANDPRKFLRLSAVELTRSVTSRERREIAGIFENLIAKAQPAILGAKYLKDLSKIRMCGKPIVWQRSWQQSANFA